MSQQVSRDLKQRERTLCCRPIPATPDCAGAYSAITVISFAAGAPLTTDKEEATIPQSRWTFLTNHSHVLIMLSRDSSLAVREVALQIGITERAVQRILSDLETSGFIERRRIGRKNHYQILSDRPLRHPIGAHRTIGDLISFIG